MVIQRIEVGIKAISHCALAQLYTQRWFAGDSISHLSGSFRHLIRSYCFVHQPDALRLFAIYGLCGEDQFTSLSPTDETRHGIKTSMVGDDGKVQVPVTKRSVLRGDSDI